MENNLLILQITHKSWSARCKGMWESTTWKIYEDMTTEIFDLYGDEEKDKKYVIKIEKDTFEKILDYIEIAKQNDEEVNARDGSVWEIVQYEKGNTVWTREAGYIYGIESLEAIANILNNLKKGLKE